MVENLYQISQVVAAIAVVASLVFVGLQVMASTRAQRTGNLQAYTALLNGWSEMVASRPENWSLWIRGLNDFDGLSAEEKVGFSQLMAVLVRGMQLVILQRDVGTLEDAVWGNTICMFDEVISTPGFQSWWNARGEWFSDRLNSYVKVRMDTPSDTWLLKDGAFEHKAPQEAEIGAS